MARKQKRVGSDSGPGTNPQTAPVENNAAESRPPVADTARRAPAMPIVAIGSSAGGLEALQEFFSAVPPDTGIAFVVVTHVRPGRDSLLPELLGSVTRMPVQHASDTTRLEPNHVTIAKDSLLNISHGVLSPFHGEQNQMATYHPIDHFFRSLAQDQQERAIGIILSGSGNDGTLGMRAVKAVGGMVMVQAPDSAKYSAMPESAIATHLVDYVLSPGEMPAALVEYCRGPYLQLVRPSESDTLPEGLIQPILLRLHAHSGQDFTCYKRSTVSRRIQRRMNVHRIDDPQSYLGFLRGNPRELDALMEELLISVTSFFRDPKAWEALATGPLPKLIAERDETPMRVWVAGCATGEEAYSVAILLHELLHTSERGYSVQIFATDLDERAIEVARAGVYPEGISVDVSQERLKTYFSHQDGSYRINKNIRDHIVFALQNVISDPPFTRLDMIVCRNVLIYLDGEAQKHVLPNFHYALRPGGLLFLGSAESVGEAARLFEPVNAKAKILRRREVFKTPHSPTIGMPRVRPRLREPEREVAVETTPQQLSRRITQLLLDRFVPCSMLVDDHGTIVHVQGRSGMFFEPEQGAPRNNVLEMAREGLGPPLAAAMRQAHGEKREVVRNGVRVRTNGGFNLVDLSVLPLASPAALAGHMLITLRPVSNPPEPASDDAAVASVEVEGAELERELRRTRENLQSTVEELETSNEELKNSNEELQSTNEELQSLNEELETSKEEMQSLNEELNTVNAELEAKVEALGRTNDDMHNLLNSMQVATIFLDTTLRVKRYTEQARNIVRLINSDIGRPLSDLTSSLDHPSLLDDCKQVLATLIPVEKEIQNREGRWYLVRLMPYRTSDNVIEGLVMTIIDIHRTRHAEETLKGLLEAVQAKESTLEAVMSNIPVAIAVADSPHVIIRAVSRYGLERIGRTGDRFTGLEVEQHAELIDLRRSDGSVPASEQLPLVRATRSGEVVEGERWMIARADGEQVPVLCTAAPIRSVDNRIIGGVLIWQDAGEWDRQNAGERAL